MARILTHPQPWKQRKGNILVVRVTPLYGPGRQGDFAAVCVEPEFKDCAGRGPTVGRAIDDLIARHPGRFDTLSAIVDLPQARG